MQTKDKKSPFQIIHRFIDFVRQTHRSESARKFTDDELVIVLHLEAAATDLRFAKLELLSQAKEILAKSLYVPESADFKQCLLALIELLLIEAKVRQKNPALYDFLYSGTLWFYHNRDVLPNEVVEEIERALTYDGFYLSPEEAEKIVSSTIIHHRTTMNTNINPDTPENYLHHKDIQPQTQSEAFIEKTFSERSHGAKVRPPITTLFDDFWIKGELALLFGETDIGKSILAVQIADAISKGANIQRFEGPQKPMKVGLFDFEHCDSQILIRYSDENDNVYQFSDIFLSFKLNPVISIPKGMNSQDFLLEEIEKMIIKHKLEVVVIDSLINIPLFNPETKEALEFMEKLKSLKLRHNISMLVIGHTPKRDLSRPITKNDMAGSMHLLNLCDSAFAIGKSAKEKNLRYLKQIKCCSAEFLFDIEYVALFRLVKRSSFLGFEYIGLDDESEHLCDS